VTTTSPEDVIRFWLGDLSRPDADPLAKAAVWWKKDDAFDREIRERFEETLERGVRGELGAWESSPRGRLALVLLYASTPEEVDFLKQPGSSF
jgi:uncharacterized protein (DUF924 family)